MEKAKIFYECLFIVNPTVGEDAVKLAVSKFMTLISENGTIIESAEWGKRKLAYPINDIPEGYYVIVYFESDSTFPMELERRFGIDEAIMRSLITKPDTRKVSTAVPIERFDRPERPPRRFDNRRPYQTDTASAAETRTAEAPAAEAPVTEAPVVEAPVAEAPVAETPAAEAPAAAPEASAADPASGV